MYFFPNDLSLGFSNPQLRAHCGIGRRFRTPCPLVERWWSAGGALVERWVPAHGPLVARNDIHQEWSISPRGNRLWERSWRRLRAESETSQTTPRSLRTEITTPRYERVLTNPYDQIGTF